MRLIIFKRGAAIALIGALAILSGCGDRSTEHAQNLVLITLDTVRADYLGCYGYPERVSPRLDDLASRAIVFERAYATAPFTGPSHASILTGQDPSRHGMILNGHRAPNLAIGEGTVTLAEQLAMAGFQTQAVVSCAPLDSVYGFGRGFAGYVRIPHRGEIDLGGDPAEVFRKASEFLQTTRDAEGRNRFFLWVHYFDAHLPYIGKSGVRDNLGIAFAGKVTDENVATIPASDVRQAYRAEVFEVDSHVGALVDRLAELGLDDGTIIAVVGDHGEYLQEHGLVNHHGLRDEVLHVPMFIHLKGLDQADRRTVAVSTADLAPTLCDLLGVGPIPTARGRSRMKHTDPEPVYAEWRNFRLLNKVDPRPGDFRISVQDGGWKLIRDVLFPEQSLVFDLGADPNENVNLADRDGVPVERLNALLDAHIRKDLPRGLVGAQNVHLDEKSRKMLRSLGYVH